MAECGVSGCGVSSSMDVSGMSAAAVHLSDSSGMSVAATHLHESSDLSAPLPWCSSQCLRAKSALKVLGFELTQGVLLCVIVGYEEYIC